MAGENKMLRTLLNKHGVDDDSIDAYLQSSSDTTAGEGPSAVETMETLLEPRRPICLDPDAPFYLEPRRGSGDESMAPEQDNSAACNAGLQSPWDAALAVRTGGMAPPSGAASVASSSGADATMMPTNLELLPRDVSVGLAAAQAFIFDPASQRLQSTPPALGTSSASNYHAQQHPFPLQTAAQPSPSLLSPADDPSVLAAATILDVLEGPFDERDLGTIFEPYGADALGNAGPYLEYG